MGKRKYQTEFSINMFCPNPVVVQAHHLEEPQVLRALVDHPCHIYMICARPRLRFAPNSFDVSNGEFFGTIEVVLQDGVESIEFTMTAEDWFSIDRIKTDYPFSELRFLDEKGELAGSFTCQFIFQACVKSDCLRDRSQSKHLNLDVLYVGQAFGKDGSRQATHRLSRHETLQKVLIEISAREPHKEVWIALLSFQPPIQLMSIEGRKNVQIESTKEESEAYYRRTLGSLPSWQQQINFTEAALIKYFQPQYNKKLKDTFPSPAHSTYSECYDLDLNAIAVEIQTGETFLHFYSEAVPVSWFHFAKFPLHSPEIRKSMFDFSSDESNS